MAERYHKETRDLLARFEAAGWRLAKVNDGGGEGWVAVKSLEQAVEALTSVDEACLRVVLRDSFRADLLLVFGNGPGELVADYSVPRGAEEEDVAELERVIDAHAEVWEREVAP